MDQKRILGEEAERKKRRRKSAFTFTADAAIRKKRSP